MPMNGFIGAPRQGDSTEREGEEKSNRSLVDPTSIFGFVRRMPKVGVPRLLSLSKGSTPETSTLLSSGTR